MSWPAMGGQQATVPFPGGNGGAAPVNPGVMIPSPQQQPAQPVQPTGQFAVPAGAQTGYGLGNLPPVPQQPAPGGFMGQVPMGPMGQYGLPNYSAVPQQGYGAQPQAPMQPVQPVQPGQQGWPLPQQPAAPQQNQQLMPGLMQGYPQQPAVPVNPSGPVNAQTRLDGPSVPPELRGRTVAEAMAMYNSMATMAQGYGRPPQQQVQPAAAGQQAAPPQQPGTAAPTFWQNPEQRIEQLMEGAIERRLGPVVQFTHMQAVTGARMAAQQQVPDFSGLEQEITALVANANPEALANPNTWIGAADIVRGRQMREGRYRSAAPQVPGQQPGGAVPPGPSSTQLPPGAFFTEAPSAPSPTAFGGTPVQPTQQDVAMAAKFKMPIEEWMAWRFGVQPTTSPNPNSTFLGQQQPTAAWHYGPFAGGAPGARGY